MLTQKSLEPITLMYRFASWLRCIQFYWDKDQERLVLLKDSKLKKHKRDYKIYNYLIIPQILVRVFLITSFAGKILFDKTILHSEIILASLMNLLIGASTVCHIQQFVFGSEAILNMNALLRLNLESGTS